MKRSMKNLLLVIIATISVIGVIGVVSAESKPSYAPYGAYVPEGIYYGYVPYKIEYGDSVRSIALELMQEYPLIETFIGFEHQVEEIIRVNGLKNPDRIDEGNYLLVPIVSERTIENKID